MEYTKEQIQEMASKARMWDDLEKKLSRFYTDEDGEYSEDNPQEEGDLCLIGEIAATHFGLM